MNPCGTCPFLKSNHGKPHKGGWYKTANIMRLWNGLRRGNAPGMVCHATDKDNRSYGGEKEIPEDVEKRECIGANILIQRELDALAGYEKFFDYRRERPLGLTRPGLRHWVNRILFSGGVECGKPTDAVGIPERKATCSTILSVKN